MQKILAIVAHPDDEIIGVGGTLCKHIAQADRVTVLILGDGKSSRDTRYKKIDEETKELSEKETRKALACIGIKSFIKESFPDNRFDSVNMLDIIKKISSCIKSIEPSIVYTHHFGDLNIDHQRTAEAVTIACRPIENNCVKAIYQFETLSSTESAGYFSGRAFLPNMFVDITDYIDKKICAMNSYKSELREFPHPRSLETIKANAMVWGSKINIHYAEAFFCLREIK
ncbi:MAG: PIG-L deacetylase family protein [Candidatus Paceibacterota bacterium]|jgi:LmbE family N-acetylglucosaminyl deacetylase